MNFKARPEIVSQNDAHIHPPERVGFHYNLPCAEHSRYSAGPVRITPANNDSS